MNKSVLPIPICFIENGYGEPLGFKKDEGAQGKLVLVPAASQVTRTVLVRFDLPRKAVLGEVHPETAVQRWKLVA